MKPTEDERQRILLIFVRSLLKHAGLQAWISLGLGVLLGLTQGVGLLMLIPFLGMIGIGASGSTLGIEVYLTRAFSSLGLPLSPLTILSLYVLIVTAHSTVSRYRDILTTKIQYGFSQALRNRLYQALCRVEWISFLHTKSSEVTQVLTSDLDRVSFATHQSLQLVGTTIIAAVHIAVSFTISVSMTLIALACGAGVLMILRPLNRRAIDVGKAFRGAMSDLYSTVSERLGGMKVAKSLSLDEGREEVFQNITNGVTDRMVQFTRVNSATRMYYEIGAATALAGFFYIALEIIGLSSGSLILIVFLFARLLPSFSMIQQSVQRISNALPSFNAVAEMQKRFEANEEPAFVGSASPLELRTGIILSRVSFSYVRGSGIWALREVDLTIQAGVMTAVVGPSGAGKSTLADLVMGLLSPDEGIVSIDGQTLKGTFLHRWRRSVGYVPQDTFLFHESIGSNLLWARGDATEAELWEALRMAAAEEFVSLMPDGLKTIVGDRGIRLSGGERQRIALARALLRRPTLLLLDEATSSLDKESERQIQEAINDLRGKLTIVVIAHRTSTILKADEIFVLEKGRIVEKGSWKELSVRPDGRFRSLTWGWTV